MDNHRGSPPEESGGEQSSFLLCYYDVWIITRSNSSTYRDIRLQIDYRTQAIAAGHPAVGSATSRVLIELASSRVARVEIVRRHGPIIAILVEIS